MIPVFIYVLKGEHLLLLLLYHLSSHILVALILLVSIMVLKMFLIPFCTISPFPYHVLHASLYAMVIFPWQNIIIYFLTQSFSLVDI